MRIALDYDGTYTKHPALWNAFEELAFSQGHEVFIVTKRGASNKGILSIRGWNVYNTDRQAKKEWCKANEIKVDIWIDDDPINIFQEG